MPSADTLVTDISPEVGITGTPVVDRAAELLYVVSKAKRADGTYVQRLHALHLAGDTFTIKDFFSPHDTATLRDGDGDGDQLPLMVFAADPATGLFGEDPVDIAATCPTCFDRGSTPSISADGTKNAIVWVLDNGRYQKSAPAILHAFDATDLSKELYVSATRALSADAAGPAVKFTVPAVANGRVFLGGQNSVAVFGLR